MDDFLLQQKQLILDSDTDSVINNPLISAKAKGVYAIVCYLKGKGVVSPTIEEIQVLCSDGRDSIRTGLSELRRLGVIPPYGRKLPVKPQGPGFVYLFGKSCTNRNEVARYKIGLSKDPESRVKQISSTTGDLLVIVSQFRTHNMGQAEDILFDRFASKRIGSSEWFELDPDSVTKFCMIQDWEV